MKEQEDWLERIKPPKYLRYFFYIAYSWYRPYKTDRSDAHFNAIIFLATIHGALLTFTLYTLRNLAFNDLPIYEIPGTHEKRDLYHNLILLSTIVFTSIVFYYGFFYKKKWRKFVNEFDYLDSKKRKKGTIYLFVYLFFIFFILFPICIYIISATTTNN